MCQWFPVGGGLILVFSWNLSSGPSQSTSPLHLGLQHPSFSCFTRRSITFSPDNFFKGLTLFITWRVLNCLLIAIVLISKFSICVFPCQPSPSLLFKHPLWIAPFQRALPLVFLSVLYSSKDSQEPLEIPHFGLSLPSLQLESGVTIIEFHDFVIFTHALEFSISFFSVIIIFNYNKYSIFIPTGGPFLYYNFFLHPCYTHPILT